MRISDWSSDVCSSDLDPKDLGRDYEAVIRVNSQSGKGGVAWVIEQDKGLKLPKRLQAAFSRHVQQLADEAGRELNAADLWQLFKRTYLPGAKDRFVLVDYEESGPTGQRTFVGRIALDGEERSVSGRGNGLISSVVVALRDACGVALDVADYNEHALGQGSDRKSVVSGKSVSVRVALGGRRILKKKTQSK